MRLPFFLRRLVAGLILLVLFAGALLWAIPRWISLEDPLERILGHINHVYPGEVTVEAMEGRFIPWVGLHLRNVAIMSPSRSQITMPELHVRLHLWRLFFDRENQGNYSIVVPSIHIDEFSEDRNLFNSPDILFAFQKTAKQEIKKTKPIVQKPKKSDVLEEIERKANALRKGQFQKDSAKAKTGKKPIPQQTKRNPDMPPPPSSVKKPVQEQPSFFRKLSLDDIKLHKVHFNTKGKPMMGPINAQNLVLRMKDDLVSAKGVLADDNLSLEKAFRTCNFDLKEATRFRLALAPKVAELHIFLQNEELNGFLTHHGRLELVNEYGHGWEGSIFEPKCEQGRQRN